MKSVITNSGEKIYDPEAILEEQKLFYKNLYTSSTKNNANLGKDIDDFLSDIDKPVLNGEDREGLTKELTDKEVLDTIKTFATNKSPGMDGFSIEFYKYFWDEIKIPLMDSYRESLDTEELSICQKQGVISLLPKDGKDLAHLKNWRPITLLNVDYKILAKVLAGRCKQLLHKLISPDQNGFVPERYIGVNITKTMHILEECKRLNMNALLVNVDFEKAFDCLEWPFIKKSLEFFGFPSQYINWIMTLYHNISTCILNNGNISTFFEPERGVRQGCPISPYLFVLAAETLALYLKQKSKIEGITINNTTFLLSQFADDTSIFLNDSTGNLEKCLKALKQFQEVSGLKINTAKTEVMPIGKYDKKIIQTLKLTTVEDYTKILGIKIADDTKETVNLNFTNITERIEQKLKLWTHRKLSLLGKTVITKTIVIPQLLYQLTVLPTPNKTILDSIQKCIYKFLWGGGGIE